MTLGQKAQIGFVAAVMATATLGPLLQGKWWVALGFACWNASLLMMGPLSTHMRLLGLSPREIYQDTRAGNGLRPTLASRFFFYAGLALLLSGWFHK
jgi:hypothetical protein